MLALPQVARTLAVSLEELFGQARQASRSKRGPASRLEQQVERIATLSKPRQRAVIEVIGALLAQQAR
ncbi:hypothetical protein [Acidovorax sp. FG27]|uniref:hypothetical protein n=1 Tax=Acidovorax sp. FG27 TaxID=3133652 RepID=UPI0030EABB08